MLSITHVRTHLSLPANLGGRSYDFISILKKKLSLFILSCDGSSLLCRLFSNCSEQGLLSNCGVLTSRIDDFSWCGAQALERRFGSWEPPWGPRAQAWELRFWGSRAKAQEWW